MSYFEKDLAGIHPVKCNNLYTEGLNMKENEQLTKREKIALEILKSLLPIDINGVVDIETAFNIADSFLKESKKA